MPSAADVRHDPDHTRYALATDAGDAVVDYERRGETLVFVHTEVPRAAEGHGVGSALVRGTLDHVRADGRTMVPACPFIAAFVERHPEYADLVAKS